MIVNGLADTLAVPQIPDLLIHEVKVLSSRVQSRDALLLPAISIQRVVVVHADDSGLIADKGIGVWVAA